MKIIVDESVSFGVVEYLRYHGHDVTAIADTATSGIKDIEVFEVVKKERAVLITRDHHFTNSLRFPSEKTACIIFIRKGNLTSKEEIELIEWSFNSCSLSEFQGRLVTLSKNHIKLR